MLAKALLGPCVVYGLIVVAKAGHETGRMLAGEATLEGALERIDVPVVLLVLGAIFLLATLRNQSKL